MTAARDINSPQNTAWALPFEDISFLLSAASTLVSIFCNDTFGNNLPFSTTA
jgi:hypothetical protein